MEQVAASKGRCMEWPWSALWWRVERAGQRQTLGVQTWRSQGDGWLAGKGALQAWEHPPRPPPRASSPRAAGPWELTEVSERRLPVGAAVGTVRVAGR